MTAPLVSVIMPSYQAAPFIAEAAGSILNQTLRDIELIVSDDGSRDGTLGVLETFRDPRLRILRNPHGGVFAALNRALAEAKGVYCARMDADDIALPARLEETLRVLQSGQADVAGTQVTVFREDGPVRDGFRQYETWVNGLLRHEEIIDHLFIEDPIPSPTLFIRREVLNRVGGYDPGVYPDDYNLTLKNFRAGLRFCKVPQPLLRWRDHDARLSRTAPELRDQRFFDIKCRYFKETLWNPERSLVVWGVGRNGKNLFKALEKAGLPAAGFTAPPRFIREKRLYDRPLKPPDGWTDAFFLLATAARSAREEAEGALNALGLKRRLDYCAFC